MHQLTEVSTDEGMTEDPGGTAAATTDGENMVAESKVIEATEPGGTATVTWTITELERTAQATENPEAVGTPGERLEPGRTEVGTTAAMAGAPTTVTRTPEVAARAAWIRGDG